MTEQAPEAQPQYPPQRYHIEYRMHVDTEHPEDTYVVAELSRKVIVGEHYSWLMQDDYEWLVGMVPLPVPGQCWHNYMIARLDDIRTWLLKQHKVAAENHSDTAIRPEMGVSVPRGRESAG